MKKILILASNPRSDLRLSQEIQDLKDLIRSNKNFDVEIEPEVRVESLESLLSEYQPFVVHFCGHGAGKKGLVFVNKEGIEQLISNEDLANLFKSHGEGIECVVLNACYTEIQADVITKYIPYVIGTSREILDRVAHYFSKGFYKGIAEEKPIKTCYDWGYSSIKSNLEEDPEISEVVTYIHEIDNKSRKFEVVYDGKIQPNLEPLEIILKHNNVLESQFTSNVSPQLEQEFIEEGKRKRYKDNLRNILDNFGQRIINREKQISDFELKQRDALINKVQDFWIKGFLKPSLYFNAATNIDNDHPSGQILRPLNNLEVIPFDIEQSYDSVKNTDITGQINNGQTLLILGEPGSGKTIALLQLAKRLVTESLENSKKPIPVVFNLSSWVEKQLTLEEWLIEELRDKYQVPKAWIKPWIESQELTLLLDGLDEVKTNHRNACVKRIREFSNTHQATEIVVCSRIRDYEALAERLLLSSVICIQPLSRKQLLDFLEKADESLSGLKTVIEQDSEIFQFATTPLILNMMTWTYHGWSSEQCYEQFQNPEDREFNLFESYIKHNLQRKNLEEKYPEDKVLHWLSWLAKIMINKSKIIFLIEDLQPTLLQSRCEKISYRISNIILGKLIVVLIVGLSFGLLDLKTGLVFGLSAGFSGGIIFFGLLKEITLFEKINFAWLFSLQKTKYRMIVTSTLALSFILILGLIQKQMTYELLGIFIGVIIYIPIDFLINSVVNSKLEIEKKTKPNQGMWLSRNNCIRLGLSGGLIGGLFGGLFVGLTVWLDQNLFEGIKFGFGAGLVSAILIGGVVGLRYGGAACMQHFNLRRILYCKGRTPRNYARFLDYASKRLLLKKVGGGYIFYHRMLMDHFAEKHQVPKR